MSIFNPDFVLGHKKRRSFDEDEPRVMRHHTMGVISGVVGVAGTVYGAISSADAQRKALNQSADAAKAAAAATDPATLQTQAQQFAAQNAANSAALEQQYNPGAAALRSSSLSSLTGNLGPNPTTAAIAAKVAAQAGTAPTGISYSSPLLQAAIARAAGDLSLGGALPPDVQALVARQAIAKAGTASGGGPLQLGRDLTTRDLGLTSLQLEQQRLQNASTIGGQESQQGLANAGLSLQTQLAGTNNLFNSANFLNTVGSGDFARILAAAQLGQSIQAPQSGLDPGSLTNLAIARAGMGQQAAQQQAALTTAGTNQTNQLIGQGLGQGLNLATTLYNRSLAPTGSSYYGDTGSAPPAGYNSNAYQTVYTPPKS